MGFNLDPVATQMSYFASLVQSDEQFPLLEAAASLAQDEYPELDVEQVLADVDQILVRLKRRLAPDASALHRLKILNRLFFEELGFQGNVNHYHDPENSFLNAVLKTRRGIPISLSVIWLELAQSIGLQAKGVNFPGHFLVKVNLTYPNEGLVVLDVFSARSLTREALLERLYEFPDIAQSLNAMKLGDQGANPLGSSDSPERPDESEPSERLGQQRSEDFGAMDWDRRLRGFLRPASERQIVERMLQNLLTLYRSHNDSPREAQVMERLRILRLGYSAP
jgi:regulator of sirC expression with transglutaminase-like and TPR domain